MQGIVEDPRPIIIVFQHVPDEYAVNIRSIAHQVYYFVREWCLAAINPYRVRTISFKPTRADAPVFNNSTIFKKLST
jgi:hypothetical protein